MLQQKPLTILIFGPSGSGKGTQSEMLSRKYGLKHLQSGEILREIASAPTDFGRKVAESMQTGFVPAEWILEIIQKTFSEIDSNQGLIIDGFARKLPEIKMLIPALSENHRSLDKIFLIGITEEEAVKRLLIRKVCSGCKKVLEYKDRDLAKCPFCGSETVSRDDDNILSIRKRLDDFKKETLPVLNFLKKSGYEVIEIDGGQSAEKVFEDICEKIEK
jgi:adenylate kinase